MVRTLTTTEFFTGRVDTFTEVKGFPWGCVVWNIGRCNFPFPKCVPLCTMTKDYHIDLGTLHFIEVESEELALKIMNYAARHKPINRSRFYRLCAASN